MFSFVFSKPEDVPRLVSAMKLVSKKHGLATPPPVICTKIETETKHFRPMERQNQIFDHSMQSRLLSPWTQIRA